MAYSNIKQPNLYFNTKLYTGTGVDNTSITGVNFQPDFTWIKDRGRTGYNHRLQDSVRGSTKSLISNLTNAEQTNADAVKSFNSDGFVLGTDINNGSFNQSGQSYVAWNWLGSNTTAANTDGSISSTVSANTTSGFSIVSFTGTGANATVGHGLGSVPKMIIVKNRDSVEEWGVYHVANGNTHVQYLNTTGAKSDDAGFWNDTTPTSSVFTVGNSSRVNQNGSAMIAYCFADVQGFSKFGSYTGNGSTDGTFVYTGFKPAWVMVKRTDSAYGWCILDSSRNTYNVADDSLFANLSNAEDVTTNDETDFLSNGFKQRNTGGSNNVSGGTYIYMAFAEQPLVGDNPATAR